MNKDFIDAIFEISSVVREMAPPDGQRQIDEALEKLEIALLEMEVSG